MATLDNFRFEWKALNAALNRIADVVNQNSPLPGDHISLTQNGKLGTEISVSTQTQKAPGGDQQAGSGGGGTPQGTWVTITAFDSNGNPVSLNVLSQDGNLNSVSKPLWGHIMVVDPATCTSTSEQVLKLS